MAVLACKTTPDITKQKNREPRLNPLGTRTKTKSNKPTKTKKAMKKTMKFLSMAALALVGAMMTGCSSDNDFDNLQQPENTSNIVTLTTTVSMDGGASTRALTAEGVKTFAAGETMAVIYNNGTSTVKAMSHTLEAGDLIDGGRSATFTFDLDNPDKGVAVTYIYPAAMANSDGSINYAALNSQNGSLTTLASTLDLATYSGDWNGASLPTATLANRLAILAITLKNADGSSEITSDITDMTVSDGTNSYAVSPSSLSKIYVAIQPVSDAAIEIAATDGTTNYIKSLTGKTYAAGNGYNVSWRMTEGKKNATVTAPTAKTGLTYARKAQALVEAGSANEGCTFYYKVNDGEWTTDLPTGKNAGDYTVAYKMDGGDEYNSIEETSLGTVNIAKDYWKGRVTVNASGNKGFKGRFKMVDDEDVVSLSQLQMWQCKKAENGKWIVINCTDFVTDAIPNAQWMRITLKEDDNHLKTQIEGEYKGWLDT